MTENKQESKIFVRVNLDVLKKLVMLAHPREISPDLIIKVIEHAHLCDKWQTEQEE